MKAALMTISMTPWFIKTSWGYMVTKSGRSKLAFATGLVPAWVRFSIATYKDIKPSVKYPDWDV